MDHHHGIPRRRNGQPRRGHRPADRVVALLAPQQTALYLVAGPHYDSGGHRRCDRAVGQPVQLGDFRPGDDPAVGLRVRPFAQVGGRVRPCGGAPDADLRGALLPGDFRHPLLALLQEGHRAPPSGHSVRNRPDRYVPHALFHRVHQNRAGAFRSGLGFGHGPVAQHSLHPAGNLYDLAGRDPARNGSGPGAESPGRNA